MSKRFKLALAALTVLVWGVAAQSETTTNIVAQLSSAHWTQGEPYNDYSPKGTTAFTSGWEAGCVAIAAAQELYNWQWPWSLGAVRETSHPVLNESNLALRFDGNVPFDWENMPAKFTGSETLAQKHAVAQLVLACQSLVQMQFVNAGGEAKKNLPGTMEWFEFGQQIDPKSGNDAIAALRADFEFGSPVQTGINFKGYGGHEVVGLGFATTSGDEEKNLIWLNLGWGGGSDGWYDLSETDASETVIKSVQLGFRPIKSVQIEPIAPVSGSEATIKWHLPKCYEDKISGFTVATKKLGSATTTWSDDFSTSKGRSNNANEVRIVNGALKAWNGTASGMYIWDEVIVPTADSVMTYDIGSSYMSGMSVRFEAKIDGEWQTLNTVAVNGEKEPNYYNWGTTTAADPVSLESLAGQPIQLRYVVEYTNGSIFSSDDASVKIDNLSISNVKTFADVSSSTINDAATRENTFTGLESGEVYAFTVTPVMSDESAAVTQTVTTTIGTPAASPVIGAVTMSPRGTDLMQEGFYTDIAMGWNIINVACQNVETLEAFPSHQSVLPQGKVEVVNNGNDTFSINIDASEVAAKWAGQRMILTLKATNSTGETAYKDLELRLVASGVPENVPGGKVWTGEDAMFGENYTAKWANNDLPSNGDKATFYVADGDYGAMMNLNLTSATELGYVNATGLGQLTIAGNSSEVLTIDTLKNDVQVEVNSTKLKIKKAVPSANIVIDSGSSLDCEIDQSRSGFIKKVSGGYVSALTDSSLWKGTVVFDNYSAKWLNPNDYGNIGSTVRLSGVSGYLAHSNPTFNPMIELVDAGSAPALNWNDGSGTSTTTFKKIIGDGTFKVSAISTTAKNEKIIINDTDAFTGSFDLASKTVAIGTSIGTAGNNGRLNINSGEDVTIASGKTWTIGGGMYLGGNQTITVNGTLNGAITAEGTGTTLALKPDSTVTASSLNLANNTLSIEKSADAASAVTVSGAVNLTDATVTLNLTGEPGNAVALMSAGSFTGVDSATLTGLDDYELAVEEGVLYAKSLNPSYDGPAPIAVWTAGEFDDDRSAHGGCEFALNGNTTNELGQIVIGDTTTLGATIATPGYDNATVLVEYEIPSGGAPTANSVPASVFVSNAYEMGAYASSGSSTLDGYYWNNTEVKAGYAFSSPAPSIPQKGYLLISSPANSDSNPGKHYVAAYVGETVSALSGGETSGLRFTAAANRVISIGVGGPTVAGAKPWAGMVVKSVALFDEWVTPSDLANYKFPAQGAVQPVDSDRYAIEPVASWVNNFKTSETNGCTLSVSGTTAAKDDAFGGVLTVGDSAAVIDVSGTANGGSVTVLVKYRATSATVNAPVVTFGETLSNSVKIDVGAYTQSARTLAVNRSYNGGNNKWVALNTAASLNEGEGYLLCARKTNDMLVYVGDSLDNMTGGSTAAPGDISYSCDLIQAIGIGGPSGLPNADATWSAFDGFVVEKVVVFNGYYTPDQIRYVENPEEGDTVNIADNTTWRFAASATPREYTNIGTLSSSGTIAIANASELTEGTYPLATWTTPQQYTTECAGYGKVGTLVTEGLAEGLSARLVYGARGIYLRVDDTAKQAARKPLVVWCYGDSITEGYNAQATGANYRILLYQKLEMLGYNVRSTGVYGLSNNHDSVDPTGTPLTDQYKWHSAKHGATAGPTTLAHRSNLSENVDTLAIQAGTPDVALLLIGVNDIPEWKNESDRVTPVFKAWTNVVSRMVKNLPDTKIVVSTILYSDGTRTDIDPTITNINDNYIKPLMANMPEAWQGHVVLADLNSYVKSGQPGIIYSDHLHPDWWGYDQMADGYLEKIVECYPDPDATDFPSQSPIPAAPTAAQLGAANKPELAAYRDGFKKLCNIRVEKGQDVNNVVYDDVNSDAASKNLEKVGYFVEFVRDDNHAHKWVWVDMDAFGDADLASVGLPQRIYQQAVTKMHVCSNHGAIDNVAADDDSVTGWIEFSPYDYTRTGSNSAAPANYGEPFDWNDTLSESGSYGCMQVFRVMNPSSKDLFERPQLMFAFNNFQSQNSNPADFGIGNFAQHFNCNNSYHTEDWTGVGGTLAKMAPDQYSVKTIEIWTKVAEAPAVVAQIGDKYYTTLTAAVAEATAENTVTLLQNTDEVLNIPQTTTVNLAENGHTFGSLTGTGTLGISGTLPSDALKTKLQNADNWHGTVELPQFTASGQMLTDYCNNKSKLKLNGINGGYLHWTDFSLNAEVILAGNFVLTDMSQRNYAFSKISGSGNISLSPGTYELTAFTIGELAEGYQGAVTNNMSSTKIVITNLMLPANTPVTPGSKVLAIGGSQDDGVKVTNVKVGGVLQNVQLERRYKGEADDGLYVKAQIDDQGYGTDQVITVITEPEQASVTVPVSSGFTGTIVVAPSVKSIDTSGVSVSADQVKVKYGTADITGAFSISSNLGIDLNADGVVDGVTVKPAIDIEADAAVDMAAESPTIKVRAIPGLWYAVKSGTALGNGGVAGDTAISEPELCTAAGTKTLTALPKNGADATFYTIMVSATKSDLTE